MTYKDKFLPEDYKMFSILEVILTFKNFEKLSLNSETLVTVYNSLT